MSAENEIREIVSQYTRAADWRDGEALAKLYEADAVVEIRYRGSDGMELLGTLSGGAGITERPCPRPWRRTRPWAGATTPPTTTWSPSTATRPASIPSSSPLDVVGTRKREGRVEPVGTFGAQGAVQPIESGYYRFAFRRTDGAWRFRHLDVIHDIPYVF